MKLQIQSDLVARINSRDAEDWNDDDWEAIVDEVLNGYSVNFLRENVLGGVHLIIYAQDLTLREDQASILFVEIFERFFDNVETCFGGSDWPGNHFVLSIT